MVKATFYHGWACGSEVRADNFWVFGYGQYSVHLQSIVIYTFASYGQYDFEVFQGIRCIFKARKKSSNSLAPIDS